MPKLSRKSWWIRVLGISLGAHLIAGIVAGMVIAIQAWQSPDPPPVVVATPAVPVEKPEPYSFDAGSSCSTPDTLAGISIIQSTGISEVALPLPPEKMETSAPHLSSGSEMMGDLASALSGEGIGGLGASGFGAGPGVALEFFGIQDAGEAVVLMIDVSGSMFLRLGPGAFERVKQEAIELVESLGMNVRFNIVVWGGGAGKWRETLVPASIPEKQAACEWIKNFLNEETSRKLRKTCSTVLKEGAGGTRHDLALRMSFELQPEVIFLISDGNARRGAVVIENQEIFNLVQSLQNSRPEKTRIHSVYFMTGPQKKAEKELLETLAKRNSGNFREIDNPHGSKQTENLPLKKEREGLPWP